jgi:D-cysteine desulfhydrase
MVSDILTTFPRFPLAQLPTPIHEVASDDLDLRIHVKRDDLTGSGLSGNKVRKLEYLIADAKRLGCDTLVTCGAVQSNCARALAVAAARARLRSHLILTGAIPDECDGNLLICRLAGADVEFLAADDPARRDALLAERTEDLRTLGRRPYVVPFGGSSLVGTLGYVQAGLEIARQLGDDAERFGEIVTPLASGGTYAGLYLGFSLAGAPIRPVGAFVCGTAAEWVPALLDLIHGAARQLGVVVDAEERDIRLIDARGNGYDQPTTAELEFIVRFTRETGLLLDPIYTGKALYALWRYLACGALGREREVMFLHTGGAFGLFPHRGALTQVLDGISASHRCDGTIARTPEARSVPHPVAAGQRPFVHMAQPQDRSTVNQRTQTISIASP